MSRRPAAITETEITRAIRAAKRAGATVLRILPGGQIEVDLRNLPDAEKQPHDDAVFET